MEKSSGLVLHLSVITFFLARVFSEVYVVTFLHSLRDVDLSVFRYGLLFLSVQEMTSFWSNEIAHVKLGLLSSRSVVLMCQHKAGQLLSLDLQQK